VVYCWLIGTMYRSRSYGGSLLPIATSAALSTAPVAVETHVGSTGFHGPGGH